MAYTRVLPASSVASAAFAAAAVAVPFCAVRPSFLIRERGSGFGKVTSISTKMKVLEERLKEAKTKKEQQTAPKAEGDKFVEKIEPFLARSKVGKKKKLSWEF